MKDENQFEDWVKSVFDHPAHEMRQAWYFDVDAEITLLLPLTTVIYLTRLFEACDTVLARFTDAQINQGLWFITGESGYFNEINNDHVALEKRRAALLSIYTLYECLFDKRCSAHLGHLLRGQETDVNPLNSICYMWWDVVTFFPQPDARTDLRQLEKVVLGVMANTLTLKSVACQEAALHGLGHWHFRYPHEIERIVGDYLHENPQLSPQLKAYARSAQCGCVQ